MHRTAAATRTPGSPRPVVVGVILVLGGIIGALALQSATAAALPRTATTTPPSFGDARPGDPGGGTTTGGGVTIADGILPDGVTVFDDRHPGVTNLDRDLLRALRDAAREAAGAGVEFELNSGWRSAAYQEQLLRDAVAVYGSEAEAARWVATAATSPHVKGEAVDIGGADAVAWLAEHGAGYGLCQVYRNEAWHFELRPDAIDRGCPARYADPAHDPRMQE